MAENQAAAVDCLRFGIPTLDEFFGGPRPGSARGIEIPRRAQEGSPAPTTSICIIGPDGTGKSILAMHMASQYAYETATPDAMTGKNSKKLPKVLYVSTDLRREKALDTWNKFGLREPWCRLINFSEHWRLEPFEDDLNKQFFLELKPYPAIHKDAAPDDTLIRFLDTPATPTQIDIAFVDLASSTAGDDWSYVNRILAMLPPVKVGDDCHLVVIDAVEGLETLVGELDSYGQQRSRRSRIAQVMRNAEGKCHVVFIVEEPKGGGRHPEEFVADAVVRLRIVPVTAGGHSYSRRTIEVEKSRGQTVIRGQHPYAIIEGMGTFSRPKPQPFKSPCPKSDWQQQLREFVLSANPDDPPMFLRRSLNKEHVATTTCAYIRVFHSLSYVNRALAPSRAEKPPPPNPQPEPGYCGFGIEHLDNMLEGEGTTVGKYDDGRGLRFGSVTALVGENGTHKARLAKAFLARGLCSKDRAQISVAIGLDDSDFEDLDDAIKRRVKTAWLAAPARSKKTDEMVCNELDDAINERVIHRFLEIRDRPSPILLHIVRQTIRKAKQAMKRRLGKGELYELTQSECGQIRLVITNLTTMRVVFPDIQSDPLFLPTLIDYVRHEGVTTLIVATEPGSPNSGWQSDFSRELRGLVENYIATWHVPFFGEDRVTISAIPPLTAESPQVIRELRLDRRSDNKLDSPDELWVDPHFEMYTGLQEGNSPQLVPLSVSLIGSGKGFESYRVDLNGLFQELMGASAMGDVVKGASLADYERLRSFSYLHGDAKLNHTLVLQVDEFWKRDGNVPRQGLANLSSYLDDDVNKQPNDPFTLFGPTLQDANDQSTREHSNRRSRRKCFSQEPKTSDRIPYLWDFGFLLLRKRCWERAMSKTFVIDYVYADKKRKENTYSGIAVKHIYDALDGVPDIESKPDDSAERRRVTARRRIIKHRRVKQANRVTLPFITWREFLHACTVVARSESGEASEYPPPFDLDTMGPETLSCLVLEMWASESLVSKASGLSAKAMFEEDGDGLIDLLRKYPVELFRVFVLLGEVISAAHLGLKFISFEPRGASSNAIASRRWYSTACPILEDRDPGDPLVPVGLPGNFTARGDWYLAIARGSRSHRLGYRVLDVLSSRRANVARLQQGLGLPTRHFVSEKNYPTLFTRLYQIDREQRRQYITYDQLTALHKGRQEVWRSKLKHYDRHARLFLKLIGRILLTWPEISTKMSSVGRNGFEIYDRDLMCNAEDLRKPHGQFAEAFGTIFEGMIIEGWISALKYATPFVDDRDSYSEDSETT